MSDCEDVVDTPSKEVDEDEEEAVIAGMKAADKVRKRAVNPQPKLDETRLLSAQGLPQLATQFRTFKADSRKDEFTQLNDVMNVVENWAHRLYPKYKFDDFLARVYQLGAKKSVKACMYRLRTGDNAVDDEGEEENPWPASTVNEEAHQSATVVQDNLPSTADDADPVDYDAIAWEEEAMMRDAPDAEDMAMLDAADEIAPVFKKRRVIESDDEEDDAAFEAYLKAQKNKRVSPSPVVAAVEEKEVDDDDEGELEIDDAVNMLMDD